MSKHSCRPSLPLAVQLPLLLRLSILTLTMENIHRMLQLQHSPIFGTMCFTVHMKVVVFSEDGRSTQRIYLLWFYTLRAPAKIDSRIQFHHKDRLYHERHPFNIPEGNPVVSMLVNSLVVKFYVLKHPFSSQNCPYIIYGWCCADADICFVI